MVKALALQIIFCWCAITSAAPQMFQELPLDSTDEKVGANVEWDDAGFIGRIRMKIYAFNGDPIFTVEMPQINPSPANLLWIDEEWVACESFLGDRGSAFFYVHVPTQRGYMIEIIAPENEDDWLINFATNDSISSAAIHSLSRARSSDFPILMRQLPIDGLDYFSTGFALLLRDGIEAFSDWRKQQDFKSIEFLSDADERTSLGRVVVAALDEKHHVIYFPSGTTNTREMLANTRLTPLPAEVADRITSSPGSVLHIDWVSDSGAYEVKMTPENEETSPTLLYAGNFDDVSDAPYTGITIEQALRDSDAGSEKPTSKVEVKASTRSSKSSTNIRASSKGSKSTPSKKSSSKTSSSSKSKKPSRSK